MVAPPFMPNDLKYMASNSVPAIRRKIPVMIVFMSNYLLSDNTARFTSNVKHASIRLELNGVDFIPELFIRYNHNTILFELCQAVFGNFSNLRALAFSTELW